MPASLVPGILSVRCPACRAAPGRPCRNRRGYLAELTHRQREALWLVEVRNDASRAATA